MKDNANKKQKQDRMLKHLPLKDRKRQEQIRQQILTDQLFELV